MMALQDLINSAPVGGHLELPPGEFFGQVVIDKPLTIVGKGKSTWIGSNASPTIRIDSAGVVLRNLFIECTVAEGLAVESAPETSPLLDQVIVRGKIKGVKAGNVKFAHMPETRVWIGPICRDIRFSPPPPLNIEVRDSPESRSSHRNSPAVKTEPPLQLLRPPHESSMPSVPQAPEGQTPTKESAKPFLSTFGVAALGLACIVLLALLLHEKSRDRVADEPKQVRQTQEGLPAYASSYPDEVKAVLRRAITGDPEAQRSMAARYRRGDGVPKDLPEAAKWHRKAAEQGHAFAQFALGWAYAYGEGVPKDDFEKVKWYRKAAEQGESHAQALLGQAYLVGEGVAKETSEAVRWFRKAATAGNHVGQQFLGKCYRRGEGVPQDYAEAVKWLGEAAKQGDTAALCELGLMYLNGEGVKENHSTARKFFQYAAELGNDEAKQVLEILEKHSR